MSQQLCRLDELPDGSSLRVDFDGDSHAHGICLLRRGEILHAYLNRCPHQDMAMDWVHGRFLDESGQHIVCAMHGAIFEAETGRCIAGPCKGAELQRVRVQAREAWVVLLEQPPED